MARKTVDSTAYRNGGSNANPLLNCAVGGRMMSKTTTEAITTGSGTATIRLGLHRGGIVPWVCPTCPIELGSRMFLFVLGKGRRSNRTSYWASHRWAPADMRRL